MAEKRQASGRGDNEGSKKKKLRKDSSDEDDESTAGDLSQVADFQAQATLKEAEYGIIESIRLKNFMCHGSLFFQFGPNVNFVVGRNGSGKSAVLTGVVVGLGGKASVTNRGGSLKAFIKDNTSQAQVTIKLRNRGSDAYKPELYGNSIIIERKMTSDGSSSYKLKSADSKRTVSTKKEELDHILDQFNIQVGNPVSILNQDTSRNFLNSKNPNHKYKFFMKATQLEQMSTEYVRIQEDLACTADTLKKKEETVPVLQKKVDELKRKVEDLSSLQQLQEKLANLMNTHAWAIVAAEEKELEIMKKELRQKEASTPKYDEKVVTCESKVKAAEKKYDDIQKELNELGTMMQDLQPQHAMAKDKMTSIKVNVKKIEKSIRDVRNQVRAAKGDKEDLEARINELRNSAKQDFEKENRIREEKMQELNEKKQKAEAKLITTEQEIAQMEGHITQSKNNVYQLRRENTDVDQNIQSKRRLLTNLRASTQNRLKLYGNYMPQLLQEIEKAARQNRFHRKPKGPLGCFLNLKDPAWALGIEVVLKSLVYCFCCHDFHDERVLKDIMQRVVKDARRPTIITSPFEDEKYDVSQHAVQCDIYPTVLHPSVLEVDDPVIYNCLIDQPADNWSVFEVMGHICVSKILERSVEMVLLIKDKTEARDFLKNRPPRNCREGFTIEGDQIYAGADQRFYSSFNKKAKVLSGDVEGEIQETEAEIQSLEEDKQSFQGRLQQLNNTIRETDRLRKKMVQQRLQLQTEIGNITFEIQQLEAVEDTAPVDVFTLEEEVQTLQTQIDQHDQELEQLGFAFKEKHKEQEEAKKNYQQMDKEISELADKVDPLKDQLTMAQEEVAQAKHHKSHYAEKKRAHLNDVAAQQKAFTNKENEVEEMIVKAQNIHPERIRTSRKPTSIDSEMNQISKRIDKEKERRGDPAEIKREHQEAKLKLDEIKHQILLFTSFIENLNEQMRVRQLAFAHFRKYIALRTRYYFVLTLDQRGYNGKMTFNHKKEELLLRVQPTQGSSQGSSDMRALSGGERSFSTVCFIMALWESMETPFRALDEFDVFMDMVNRKISMDLMMKVAKEQKSRQFIFLTPQDMSKIAANPLVRISRMPDPDRTGNQSRLPFRPVGEEEEEEV